ncbi:hypothetical protein DFH08DRAFT_655482, partial [Mycena albidolilacea]
YRAARAALLALRGPGPWEQVLQDLKPTDIRGMNERALNDEEKEDNRKAHLLAGLPDHSTGEEINEYGEPVELTTLFNLETGEGRRNLSWIWYSGGIRDSDELILLEEEMQRVLEFCAWKAHWWDDRAEARSNVTPELAEGLRAYALAQAARERAWELDWRNKWAAVRER